MKAAPSMSESALVDASGSATFCAEVSSDSVAVFSEPLFAEPLDAGVGVFALSTTVSSLGGVLPLSLLATGSAFVDTVGGTNEVLDTVDAVWLTLGDGLLEAPKRRDLIFDFMRARMAIVNSGRSGN